jgi:hypothetical protein
MLSAQSAAAININDPSKNLMPKLCRAGQQGRVMKIWPMQKERINNGDFRYLSSCNFRGTKLGIGLEMVKQHAYESHFSFFEASR